MIYVTIVRVRDYKILLISYAVVKNICAKTEISEVNKFVIKTKE